MMGFEPSLVVPRLPRLTAKGSLVRFPGTGSEVITLISIIISMEDSVKPVCVLCKEILPFSNQKRRLQSTSQIPTFNVLITNN